MSRFSYLVHKSPSISLPLGPTPSICLPSYFFAILHVQGEGYLPCYSIQTISQTSETLEWMEMPRWSFQGHLCADIQQFSPLNIVNVPSPSPSYQGRVFRALFPFLCVIAFLILGSSNTLLNPNTPITAHNTDLIDPSWNAHIRRLKMTTPTQFSLPTYQSSVLLCVCISSRAMGPWLAPMGATPIQLVNSNRTLC